MHARMNNPALVLPGALDALQAFSKAAYGKLPASTIELVNLRASQINGCSVCVEMHARALRQQGLPEEKVFAVGAWRESPYFSEAERAALALAEEETRLSDRPDAVSDAVWDEAARHYAEPALAALVVVIAAINTWNRLNVAIRQTAGAWTARVSETGGEATARTTGNGDASHSAAA